MLPLRLEIKNFLAYRSPEPIIFDGIHLACITGANGAGKSSLLDAITWALWGKARARRDEELVHMGQNDMYVQLDFEQEGTVYRVVRRRTRKAGGSGQLDLFVVENGELHTRSESSTRLTQQKINDLLRLDYDTFVHSAFLQQGKADAFTTKAPAQRKQILADILGLDRWEAYEETAKVKLKAIGESLAGIEAVIQGIEHDLAREPELQELLAAAEQAQHEAKAALDEAESRLREVERAPGDHRAALGRKTDLERRQRERQRDLETIRREIEQQEKRIAEFQYVLAAREEIEEGYAALQAARQDDHTLGDKLMQLNDVDRQRNTLQRALDAAAADLQREISGYESAIRQLERTIQAADGHSLAELQAEIDTLRDLEARSAEFQQEAVTFGEQQGVLKVTNERLLAEMKEIKDRINRLSVATGATCPLCGQPLNEEHRAELLDQLQKDGTRRGDEYRANQRAVDQMAATIKENNRRIKDAQDDLKRLAALKQREATLQAGVDAANEARQRLDEQQIQRDAAQQALESGDFGHDIRRQIEELDEQRDALGYDQARHSAARQQLETFKGYETRQRQLEQAAAALPDAESMRQNAEERQERGLQALAEDQLALDKLQTEISDLEALVKEFHAREQETNVQRARERKANDQLVEARQELRALDSLRTRRDHLESQRAQQREQKALYEELRLAFGKNGIPAMIIETAIPELENGANDILSRMTDGRMQISMSTQREKVTGGITETLDIQIADELGTRSYEMYSGGEAFRINFAIRVALSQLLARRAGAHLRTLFLDEGFGTQDEDGRNKLIEAITTVQNDFALILIITHIDELRDSFPVHIALDKTREGSRISVR